MLKKILVNSKNTKYNIIIGKKTFSNLSKIIKNNNKGSKHICIIDSKVYKKHKKYEDEKKLLEQFGQVYENSNRINSLDNAIKNKHCIIKQEIFFNKSLVFRYF